MPEFITFQAVDGVKKEVFSLILDALDRGKTAAGKHLSRGAPTKLTNAYKFLLMYCREYRTMFHIGVAYGIFESRVCEIIKEVERILIQDSHFHLQDKNSLLQEENHFEVVLIDAVESPVERPQKTEAELFGQEKASHSKDTVGYREVEP